jgi:hypothetical protein
MIVKEHIDTFINKAIKLWMKRRDKLFIKYWEDMTREQKMNAICKNKTIYHRSKK